MAFTQLDINKSAELISLNVDNVTCIECCKYYMAPMTALCGHTMCRGCWTGRKKCAYCESPVDRKTHKLNLVLQKITEHTHTLKTEFEKIFKVKLDEFSPDYTIEKEFSKDPTKNVRDWLADSENQFSAPVASQKSTQDFNSEQQTVANKILIHSKANSTKNMIHVGIPQDDWDKIEEMPDTEEMNVINKENAIGPMDIEPFIVDQFEFTTDNPRRSSRKRDIKNDCILDTEVNSVDENNTKNSNQKNSKVLKNKQNWANVKKMKKEFSKFNKKYKNKLNVSIEMCKKKHISGVQNRPVTGINNSEDRVLSIDNNTTDIDNQMKDVALSVNAENVEFPYKNLLKAISEEEILNNIEFKTQINEDKKRMLNDINSLNNVTTTVEPLVAKNDQLPSVAFVMRGALQSPSIEQNFVDCCNNNPHCITVNTDNAADSTEDIEITIKIGSTLTNISIKKKQRDVQLKINSDREIQTSLEEQILNKKNASCSPIKQLHTENNVSNENNAQRLSQHLEKCITSDKVVSTTKTLSKKNTESADTVQNEITASIEKELSKEMEKSHVEKTQFTSNINQKGNTNKLVSDNDVLDEDCLNDLDLFDNESLKEGNVELLKSSSHTPSEILISSMKSNKIRKHIDKRDRDSISDDLPISKRMKVIHEDNEDGKIDDTLKTVQSKDFNRNSQHTNYDFIIDQVFANIDMDLAKKTHKGKVNSQIVKMKNDMTVKPLNSKVKPDLRDSIHRQSENVFSILEKDNDSLAQLLSGKTQARAKNQNASAAKAVDVVSIDLEVSTPIQDNNDHSDESIVEETPQKSASFRKVKQISEDNLNAEKTIINKSLKLKRAEIAHAQNKSSSSPTIMNVISLSETTNDSVRKNNNLGDSKSRPTLETPITITKFVDQIQHKSTPLAKKSLNFNNEGTEISDMDQTLCPNSLVIAKTTQEKEFMSMAFEKSPHKRTLTPLTKRNLRLKSMKYCLVGSCLTPSEISNVKLLCSLRNWDYVDKYTNNITHLVVGVDEENKSQRSVKYMCALAASKWIISYEWVQKCLQMKKVIDEEPYEALDNTGEPGPRRSRLSTKKIFQGITFFCMPPFSVLDVETLTEILEAAGGRVVDEARAVRVTGDSISLLLAEPEHTQEDKFIYLAMELSIVPVNSEWVLNCLGSYTLCSVQELLLCPESLLPPATARWPQELMAKDID